jgi:O-antigen/teichoic acid export membrane protein
VPETPKNNRGFARHALAGAAWLTSSAGVQAALALAVLAILARLLTPVDFGTISGALVIVGFLQLVADLGIGPALVQLSDLEQRHIDAGFTYSDAFSALFWVPRFGSWRHMHLNYWNLKD